MDTGIFYFSATGNGLDVSKNLAEVIHSDLYFIPAVDAQLVDEYERIIIVSPVNSFGLPVPVKKFINDIKRYTNKHYYCVLHYGGFPGNAVNLAQRLFEVNNLPIQAVYKIQMPENFTIVVNVPDFFVKRILKQEKKKIQSIAESIHAGKRRMARKNVFSFLDSVHEKNSDAWKRFDQSFIVTNDCIACGHCVNVCSQNNITREEGKPTFNHHCVACLACYHRCPKSAINYGERTIGKPRYQNPNVDLEEIKCEREHLA